MRETEQKDSKVAVDITDARAKNKRLRAFFGAKEEDDLFLAPAFRAYL
jgi:hypothetical protein